MNQMKFQHFVEPSFVYSMSVFTLTSTVSDQVPNRGNWITGRVGLNTGIGC